MRRLQADCEALKALHINVQLQLRRDLELPAATEDLRKQLEYQWAIANGAMEAVLKAWEAKIAARASRPAVGS